MHRAASQSDQPRPTDDDPQVPPPHLVTRGTAQSAGFRAEDSTCARLLRRAPQAQSMLKGFSRGIAVVFSQPVDFATDATCFVIPDAVSPSDCRHSLTEPKRLASKSPSPDYPPSYRNNDRLVFDDPGLAAWLYERLRPFLPAHLSDDHGS